MVADVYVAAKVAYYASIYDNRKVPAGKTVKRMILQQADACPDSDGWRKQVILQDSGITR